MTYFSLALAIVAAFAGLLVYGAFSARKLGLPTQALPVSGDSTAMDRALSPLLEQHQGATGLSLLTDNLEAFAIRASAARMAERSLDLQYYYWKEDLTGSLLARELIAAADRGVRVRLLIDDINTRGRDKNYRALDRHPNIHVRLFNPTRCRENALLRGIELVLRFWSVNRRMHNKAWIADGRLAVVGGRNIGDAYFDAAENSNFRDMDVVAVGAAVEQASALFDSYWNSAVVFPILTLSFSKTDDLPLLRQRLEKTVRAQAAKPYVTRALEDRAVADMLAGTRTMHWTDNARIVSDPPEKASAGAEDSWLLKSILPALTSAQRTIAITSPYFIPRLGGAEKFVKLATEGVAISVLTNSLAATDVAAVHGAYAPYRKKLIEGGVDLYELRVRHRAAGMSLFGSKGASLHTKAFVVDGKTGFVGSFNFDPRSVALNTEMGILFEQPELAAEMLAVFKREVSAKRSYRLLVRDGKLRWQDGPDIVKHEPDASLRRRAVACVVSHLPVESQL